MPDDTPPVPEPQEQQPAQESASDAEHPDVRERLDAAYRHLYEIGRRALARGNEDQAGDEEPGEPEPTPEEDEQQSRTPP